VQVLRKFISYLQPTLNPNLQTIMKKLATTIITLSFLGLWSYGQTKGETAGKEPELRQTLIHLRDSFFIAQKQGDRSVLERLLVDSFYFVHSTGVVTNRKEFIDRTVAQAGRGPVIEFKEQNLFIYNNRTAIWLSRSISKNPQGVETNFRATDVLVKDETKGWQWVSVHSTRLGSRPKAFTVAKDSIQAFVGTYQISPGRTLLVTLSNDTLVAEASGVRQRELIPVAPKEFVWFSPDSNADMRMTFVSDTDARKQYAVLIMEGNEVWRAEKLK